MDYKLVIYVIICDICYTLGSSMIMVPETTTFFTGYDRNILHCTHNSTKPLLGVHWTYSHSLKSAKIIVFAISATGEGKAFEHLVGRASVSQSASLLIKDVNRETDAGIYECGMTFVGEQLMPKRTLVEVYDLPMNGTRQGPVTGGNCYNLSATGFEINFECSINAPELHMIYDWTIDNKPEPNKFAKRNYVIRFGYEAKFLKTLHVQCTGKLKKYPEVGVFYSLPWDCEIDYTLQIRALPLKEVNNNAQLVHTLLPIVITLIVLIGIAVGCLKTKIYKKVIKPCHCLPYSNEQLNSRRMDEEESFIHMRNSDWVQIGSSQQSIGCPKMLTKVKDMSCTELVMLDVNQGRTEMRSTTIHRTLTN